MCQVPGLADTSIVISYGVVGSPVLFPTTATYGSTIVRFGSHPADSGPIKKSVKLKNTSPCELMVDWEVYNKVPGDQQLIDLTVAVGKPFPVDITDDEESCDDDLIPDDVIKGSCDLVKVMIKAHEGLTSSHPIRLIKLSSRDIQVSLLID
ncbi:deleted in lung and esophageal cancer protein 1-like [Dysidea avara]|uniref:deleted in lung and esophageal cancer protein 1-like n=1 Tax=Dysidea avara TaxID=196820 RepID=UPI0033307485